MSAAKSPAAPPPELLDAKRFVIVTGKGGVGKTTVAAAQALSLAARGRRVLICMCNAKERMSGMFGVPTIGSAVVPVASNVWAVNMDPARALEEYGAMTLKSTSLYKLLFDNRYVRSFLRAVPGMQEWTMLGKAWWHTTEELGDGKPRYDTVILDAPATGHGLDMLRVPKVILDAVPPGILRRDAEFAWQMFQDETRSAVVLVTLPEEMPTTETIELARAIREELRFPIAKVVVNCMTAPLFAPDERARMRASSVANSPMLQAAARRAVREELQSAAVARLDAALGLPRSILPLLYEDASRPSAISELAACLA